MKLAIGLVLYLWLQLSKASTEHYIHYDAESLCEKFNSTPKINIDGLGGNVSGILIGTDNEYYKLGVHCWFTIIAPINHRVVVSLKKVDLRYKYDGSCEDYIKIQNNAFCSPTNFNDEWKSFISSGNSIGFEYRTVKRGVQVKTKAFELSFTALSQGDVCNNHTDVFLCDPIAEDRYCVPKQFMCDGHNNCYNDSDEWEVGGADCNPRFFMWLPIFLGLMASVIFTALGYKYYIRKRFGRRRGYDRAI